MIENNKLDRPLVLVISHWALFPSDIWTGGFFCYGTILPSILLAVEAMHKRTKQAKDENLLAIDQAPEAKLPFMIISSAVDFRKQASEKKKSISTVHSLLKSLGCLLNACLRFIARLAVHIGKRLALGYIRLWGK